MMAVGMTGEYTGALHEVVERAGRRCPVHHSLHPDIEAGVSFEYQ